MFPEFVVMLEDGTFLCLPGSPMQSSGLLGEIIIPTVLNSVCIPGVPGVWGQLRAEGHCWVSGPDPAYSSLPS